MSNIIHARQNLLNPIAIMHRNNSWHAHSSKSDVEDYGYNQIFSHNNWHRSNVQVRESRYRGLIRGFEAAAVDRFDAAAGPWSSCSCESMRWRIPESNDGFDTSCTAVYSVVVLSEMRFGAMRWWCHGYSNKLLSITVNKQVAAAARTNSHRSIDEQAKWRDTDVQQNYVSCCSCRSHESCGWPISSHHGSVTSNRIDQNIPEWPVRAPSTT